MNCDYLCNLIIPGAAKSGTSSLHAALNRHPEICMSKHKEPHHFAIDKKFAEGPIAHNSHFITDHRTKFFGESSTGYMISEKAISRIAKHLCHPKIIIILRHPVDRLISHYRWRVKLGLENRNLLHAIRQSGYNYDPNKPNDFGYMSYLQFSKYSYYIPIWLKTFGETNVLLLLSDDLYNNMQKQLLYCSMFLGLDGVDIGQPIFANKTDHQDRMRPPVRLRLLSGVFPRSVKKSRAYRFAKKHFINAFPTRLPDDITNAERAYIESELSADIEYYEDIVKRRSESRAMDVAKAET